MWNYIKCTSEDRLDRLEELAAVFYEDRDCLKYLSEVQRYINSTQTTVVLIQDLEVNILIEMDYVPVNDYIFRVVSIENNGIKKDGMPCKSIKEAVNLFLLEAATKGIERK